VTQTRNDTELQNIIKNFEELTEQEQVNTHRSLLRNEDSVESKKSEMLLPKVMTDTSNKD